MEPRGRTPQPAIAVPDLTFEFLNGSAYRADFQIDNAQQSLSEQRDRWFEFGSLQRGVSNEPCAGSS